MQTSRFQTDRSNWSSFFVIFIKCFWAILFLHKAEHLRIYVHPLLQCSRLKHFVFENMSSWLCFCVWCCAVSCVLLPLPFCSCEALAVVSWLHHYANVGQFAALSSTISTHVVCQQSLWYTYEPLGWPTMWRQMVPRNNVFI